MAEVVRRATARGAERANDLMESMMYSWKGVLIEEYVVVRWCFLFTWESCLPKLFYGTIRLLASIWSRGFTAFTIPFSE